jgi:selenocysteine lyase/cysteine desulfurase
MSDPDTDKVAQLRELIPATGAGIYLDTAYRGPLPAETAAAMREADDWELRVGRATEGREEDVAQRRDEARAVLAALIGADPDEIALIGPMIASPGEPLVDPLTGAVTTTRRGSSIDATLAVGAIPMDVATLEAETIFFSGDRWLLGPEGSGAIWSRRASGLDLGVRDHDIGRTATLGLARSVGWLEMYVGLDWIYERGARLARRLLATLAGTAGVEVLTPADTMATTICFRLTAWPTEDALDELRRRVFAIIGANGDGTALRASVAWFNTEEELDRFAAAVAEIAQYTPETLPRRPSLVVH